MIHQTQSGTNDATNQFVEIFPNYSKLDSNTRSLPVDTLYIGTNGSLVFQTTYSFHSGRYLCHVSNSIGHPIHQIVNVNVKGKVCISVH